MNKNIIFVTLAVLGFIVTGAGVLVYSDVIQDKTETNLTGTDTSNTYNRYYNGRRLGRNGKRNYANQAITTSSVSDNNLPLSEAEVNWLMKMREEEKLARDVYLTLYDKWNLRVFSNIARAEQIHTDAIKDLLDYYNLEDPVTDDTIGNFTDSEMQKLYDNLVKQGNNSLTDALKVGVTIEKLDINDLEKAISASDHSNIISTYERLKAGSYNHLNAFNRNLEREEAKY